MFAQAIAIVSDLIFSTKISSTASSLGVNVRTVRRPETLEEVLKEPPALAIVDLEAESLDALEAIRSMHAVRPRPRIVAFAAHVEKDLIQAAREAGADEVLARSAFVHRLPALLSGE